MQSIQWDDSYLDKNTWDGGYLDNVVELGLLVIWVRQGGDCGPFWLLQLDWLWVSRWDYVITFAVEVRFRIRDQIRNPRKKLHGAMSFKIEIEKIFC